MKKAGLWISCTIPVSVLVVMVVYDSVLRYRYPDLMHVLLFILFMLSFLGAVSYIRSHREHCRFFRLTRAFLNGMDEDDINVVYRSVHRKLQEAANEEDRYRTNEALDAFNDLVDFEETQICGQSQPHTPRSG